MRRRNNAFAFDRMMLALRVHIPRRLSNSAAGVAAQQLVDGSAATVQDVNVSRVQEVLVGTFKQRVHGPPFS